MSARSNNLEKMLENAFASPKTKPLKRQNSIDNLVKMLGGSPSKNSPSPSKNWFDTNTFMSPVKSKKPARKIAPRSAPKKPARKIAPGLIADSNRRFAHKFDATNTGKKDTQGRIIYAGPAGGLFVISSIGSRVPFIYDKTEKAAKNGTLNYTGKLDRDGHKIYKGKQGGLFVIKPSGKRGNPLRPFRN
ncbi:PBCV-specific basic adaptor domain-containing protein [Paramecium bursaria Chlorella virus NE-JV-1]|nr:PBCV-specific basic adaptor domain-containing protein [Paramecium bursaria Chlorella virus NE-JV-1]